jgi:hypothetical protein
MLLSPAGCGWSLRAPGAGWLLPTLPEPVRAEAERIFVWIQVALTEPIEWFRPDFGQDAFVLLVQLDLLAEWWLPARHLRVS